MKSRCIEILKSPPSLSLLESVLVEFVQFVPVGAEEAGSLLDPLGLRSSSPRHHLLSACQSFPYWTFQGVNALLHLLFVIVRGLMVQVCINKHHFISFDFWLIFPPDYMRNLEPRLAERQAGVKLCWPSGSALAEAGYNTLQASIQESSAWSPSLPPNAAMPAALLGIPAHTRACTREITTRPQTHIGRKTSWICSEESARK